LEQLCSFKGSEAVARTMILVFTGKIGDNPQKFLDSKTSVLRFPCTPLQKSTMKILNLNPPAPPNEGVCFTFGLGLQFDSS